ncbi:MAG TPA: DUF4097 family beta strand repeat-containing protein [Vicinamibacterales bacterium]|nr:DUF4097 family beta strand repeat-containing protein [Vicinamibacterales bacterium]
MKTTSRTAVLVLSLSLGALTAAAAEFEKVVPVSRGMSLDVRLFGGEVAVRAWDRDEVRIRATHFATDVIDVATAGSEVSVRARARTGKPHAIDFAFDVPAWMAVSIRGTYLEVSVQGTAAGVSARTVRGDVRVSGGAGDLTLASAEGEVVLEGGRGKARLESVNNAVRVNGFEGELVAETVSGSVKLRSVSAALVVASAVSGDISWEGPLTPKGTYQFATHSGDVDLTVPTPANATLAIRSFEGHVHSTLAETLPDLPARRKRFTLTLGSGAASAELETFTGTISLRPQ